MNKTYHIICIGCQMNKSDSERLAAYLEDLGYHSQADRGRADLVVLVTCGIRQSAEDRVYGLVGAVRRENPRAIIVLTGCLSDRKDVQQRLKRQVDIWLNIADMYNLAGLLDTARPAAAAGGSYLSQQPKYKSDFSAFVPIGNGCNNFCSYCVVPYARGREVYRPADDVLSEIKDLAARGYKEITLIAQNVNSYRCGEVDFPQLLAAAAKIKGDFWLRFTTSHPKDMSDKLISTVAAHDKICNHFHVAMQSGDDEILHRMNRRYSAGHFYKLIKRIRKMVPGAAISTDIIVGFPGETEEKFKNTKKLMKKIGFDMAYIARFSPRYGTAAAKMEDNVSAEEKKKREAELIQVLEKSSYKNNKKYIGKEVRVLINQAKDDYVLGSTATSITVKAPGSKDMAGRFVFVKINKAENFGLKGEIV